MELLGGVPDAKPSLRELLYHAYAERHGAGIVFALIVGIALLCAAILSPTYRATAVLAVLPAPEFTVRAAAGSHEANASALALDQIMKAETEILGSDDLHAATLVKVGPSLVYPDVFAPTPRGVLRRVVHAISGVLGAPWRVVAYDQAAARDERGLRRFRSALTVLPAKDSNVISLAFDNRDGRVAANTVNTMLALYAAKRTRLYDDPQLGIIRREAADGARLAAEADRALADFKRDHSISDYASERDLLLHRRSQAEQAAADAQASVEENSARVTALGRILRGEPTTIGVFDEKDSDTRLSAVNSGLQDARAKLAAARDKYKETSRVVTALLAEVGSHEAEAQRLTHDPTQSVVRQGRNPSIDPLRLDKARAAAELAASQARLTAEQFQEREITIKLVRLDSEETNLAALQLRKANAEQDFREASHLLAERHLSEAEDAIRLANVRVIQSATVPQSPRPTKLLLSAAGLILGCLAAIGWVMARFILRPVFLTAEGLESASGLPVLAVFARTTKQGADQLIAA